MCISVQESVSFDDYNRNLVYQKKNSFQKIVHKLNHSSVINETFYVKSDE